MWTLALIVYSFTFFIDCSSVIIKCCPHGYSFGDNSQCVMSFGSQSDFIPKELAFENVTELTQTCYRSGESAGDLFNDVPNFEHNVTRVGDCIDVGLLNGTIYTRPCPVNWRERIGQCESVFKPVYLWGASIVIFANLVYICFYLIIVILFFAVEDLRRRAYDRAVLSYNGSQLVLVPILVAMGCSVLCHRPLKPVWVYKLVGLSLQFLLTAALFWLNVMCFDMTLVITRFRWIPGSDVTGSEDRRKFRMYAAYAWGGATIVTAITCFVEFCPWIPTSSPLKPNFERFDDGANYAVIIHVTVVPLLTLILNNALFAYTTYKVIQIGKSTTIANTNNKNVKKRYYVFLRLYILMDAPWIVSVLAAVYPDLWILKFYRMLQPILMLLAILPKKKFYRAIKCSNVPITSTFSKRNKNTTACETRC